MQVNYEELIQEIKEITTVDGFISSCLEIKESMFFYERDLMLAAYSASLELLTVVALFSGALQGKRELAKVEAEVVSNVEDLLEEISKYHFPLDIQYVVDRYLEDDGLQTTLRMPVYTEMIRTYASSGEYHDDDLDSVLREAHHYLRTASPDIDVEPKLNSILGRAGTKMLRGAKLRPIWLQISHPRIQLVLLGLQTMMNNFRVTPYFNFPVEDIAIERQKRKKIGGNVVLDLGVFRNFRQGGSGYTDLNIALVKDEYDHFFESLFSSLDHVDVEPDRYVIDLITMIMETRLVNENLDPQLLQRLLVYCDTWQLSEVSDVVLEILAELDVEDPLFYRFWILLKSFDGKALPAIRRFARANRESPLLPYLALFLSYGPPRKRRWALLTEIFEHYPEENAEKAQVAVSIARYGGPEAVAYLENVLTHTDRPGPYREKLEEALARAMVNVASDN